MSAPRIVSTGMLLALLLAAAGSVPAAAQEPAEQVFELHPGWNAVYLEIQPDPEEIEAAMAGIPVSSVWTWRTGIRPQQFVQDPSENLPRIDGWFGYFPPSRPDSVLNNLFTFEAGRAYLIRLDGETPVTWHVSGRAAVHALRWEPDSFNLVGFDVDPDRPPTIGEYLAPSPAHDGQSVYELGPDGIWHPVADPYSTPIVPGAAYWVYCQGPSSYQGPLTVEGPGLEGLDFSTTATSATLSLRNALAVDADVVISRGNGSVPLVVRRTDPVSLRDSWPELPASYTREVAAGDSVQITLGVRRADLGPAESFETLQISNGLGARLLLPVHVAALHSPARSTRAAAVPYAGLWVGTALVCKVSQAQEAGAEPTPTGASFPLRFILHVDAGGGVRLLKEVVRMWKDGTYEPDPDNPGFQRVATGGHYVLVTDDSLLDQFKGVQLRDGQLVGERVSTVSYDFDGTELQLLGSVGLTGSLDGTIVLPVDFPTNPFYHRYHPDHDNLNAEFLNFRAEAYQVTREIHWRFSADDPYGDDNPEWGSDLLGGTYSEEITGLHRNPVFVAGTFRMRRVSAVTALNQ